MPEYSLNIRNSRYGKIQKKVKISASSRSAAAKKYFKSTRPKNSNSSFEIKYLGRH